MGEGRKAENTHCATAGCGLGRCAHQGRTEDRRLRMRSIAHVPHALDAMRRLEAESEKWQKPASLAKLLWDHHVTRSPRARPDARQQRTQHSAMSDKNRAATKTALTSLHEHELQNTRLRVGRRPVEWLRCPALPSLPQQPNSICPLRTRGSSGCDTETHVFLSTPFD